MRLAVRPLCPLAAPAATAGPCGHPRLPPAASVAHSPEFPEYAAALGQALDRFERDELQKVVLARRRQERGRPLR